MRSKFDLFFKDISKLQLSTVFRRLNRTVQRCVYNTLVKLFATGRDTMSTRHMNWKREIRIILLAVLCNRHRSFLSHPPLSTDWLSAADRECTRDFLFVWLSLSVPRRQVCPRTRSNVRGVFVLLVCPRRVRAVIEKTNTPSDNDYTKWHGLKSSNKTGRQKRTDNQRAHSKNFKKNVLYIILNSVTRFNILRGGCSFTNKYTRNMCININLHIKIYWIKMYVVRSIYLSLLLGHLTLVKSLYTR